MALLPVSPKRLARAAVLLALALVALGVAAPQASAQLMAYDGAFGAGGGGPFERVSSVATDEGGRVYVADALRGRVDVFDDAAGGNRYLRTVGEGILANPVNVTIDIRGRLYVSDVGRDAVYLFDGFNDGNAFRRPVGTGTGTALGQLAGPRGTVATANNLVYVVERTNARVQFFRPQEGRAEPVSAWGTAEPTTFEAPEGIARDGQDRIYVSDESAEDGEVRMYDRRGMPLGRVIGPGRGDGQVSSPRGMVFDPVGRLVVADAGNGRIQVFGAFAGGPLPFVAAYSGGGAGELKDPSDIAVAPGAYIYVADTGNGRVVRLRYDDQDRDGAIDARDTCRGLADPLQRDSDRDGAGDECDDDDDNDARPDAEDRCPRTSRGPDANGDGCADPRSWISSPRSRTYRRSAVPTRIAGRAYGDALGVQGVEVAVARQRGRRCAWYRGGRFRPGPCDKPLFFQARGRERWSARVRLGRTAGVYRVVSRAFQRGGVTETLLGERNDLTFRLR